MFEEYQICPYTGLRSFTEEESLYFKGREEHIDQATEQLQRNKFLMLTGASGDGKSSLVYAGIVPNARAGFLKSKYTQWCVADFRPERTPFKNLCRSLARQLDIDSQSTVESELQHGFSAVVDLYKNSKRYADTSSLAWAQADDAGRAAIKREAANLLVIVDQFEEFFTNPENYHKGVPSGDSNLVLNLLLETSRIAIEEDLPIYVVFTMRSDYIGQCAAFRSLPEYIGFSQFFVPRLNRAQLQQVIEEPAALSGNKITRRLTERLIHDIAEGVDQLPILQHALNQIWHAANFGSEEMDLVHYAMVGGLPPDELPDEHVAAFRKWFEKLPDRVRRCYHKPTLQNVLDTHANKLFESAAESYRNKVGKEISDEVAKEIVRKTFSCLTKIDQSRAVRNRMTVREIWDIINRKDINVETVGWVLNVFREPGNTFIRPFITEDVESGKLKEDDILDITHESLIRNWVLLEEWAKAEFNNYTVYLDFEQQLGRWVESGKQGGFLLSIGPLTYFENWYNRATPNSHWIARYLPEGESQDSKLTKARIIRDNSREFIERSARKHIVTRTIMRYGPRRIAAVLAIIALVTLSSFAVRTYIKRQNNYVLDEITEQTYAIANGRKANFADKSVLFAEQLKSGRMTVPQLIAHVDDPILKVNVASRLGALLVVQGQQEPRQHIISCLQVADSVLFEMDIESLSLDRLTWLFKEVSYLRVVNELAFFYRPSKELKHFNTRTGEFSKNLVLHVLKNKPVGFDEINQLHVLLEHAINQKVLSDEELDFIIESISPWESDQRDEWIVKSYQADKLMVRGFFNYGITSNGLYQELAYLFAAKGDEKMAQQCIDSLLRYQQNMHQQDYTSFADNATNIAVVFHLYGHEEQFRAFSKYYAQRKGISEVEYYQQLIGRCDVRDPFPASLNEFEGPILINLNCQAANEDLLEFIFRNYRKSIEENIKVPDERNFLLALAHKDEAVMRFNLSRLRGEEDKYSDYYQQLDQAFIHYERVNSTFLETRISMAQYTNTDAKLRERKYQFLYPDYRTTFNVTEPRRFQAYYTSELFIRYLLDKELIAKYYEGGGYEYFVDWLEGYLVVCNNFLNGRQRTRNKPDLDVMIRFESYLSNHPDTVNAVDLNILYLTIGSALGRKGEVQSASNYYERVRGENFINYFRTGTLDWPFFCEVVFAAQYLAEAGNIDMLYELAKSLKEAVNRSVLYAYVATELLQVNPKDSVGLQMLDSAIVELDRVENRNQGQPNRIHIAAALAMEDPEQNSAEAYRMIKNIYNKFVPIQRICQAFAMRGSLYDAKQHILPNSSDGDLAVFLWNIVFADNLISREQHPEWEAFSNNYSSNFRRWIGFVGENN